MINVNFKVGDIIEEVTDGLVCSGNVQLNMSGGINGELLLRGGNNMQVQLHQKLKDLSKNFVEPGFAMRIGPEPFHFKTIVYTVAIDGFYDSSVELVEKALINALSIIEQDCCSTVSIPALATGYGPLSYQDFGIALKRCLEVKNWNFTEIKVVLKDQSVMEEVRQGYKS